MRRRLLTTALTLLFVQGCALQSGTFGAQGFHHSRYAYDVRYADAGARLMMPPGWRLDNYRQTSSGAVAKSSGFYKSSFEFDTNRDDRPDVVDSVPTFDLRFEHAPTGGIVWLRTIPAPSYESDRALYLLSQDYLAGASAAGFELAQFGARGTNAEKQFVVQTLETKPARLAECEALALTIEIASRSELQSSTNAQRRRVKLVLVRAGLSHRVPASDAEFPTVLVAGYANQPEFFQQHLSEFHGFLERVVLEERAGYRESAGL
jgi:hypothetical protein